MKNLPIWGTSEIIGSLMKRNIFLFLLIPLFYSISFSQSIYSEKYLEQASMEELDFYLKTSRKLKKTGANLTIAGSVIFLFGNIVFAATLKEDYGMLGYTSSSDLGGWMTTAGLVTTLIGVPVLILGSSRVKRITRIMDAKSVSFGVAACSFHNILSQNTQPGITLRLNL